jgi:hypothetical protein
MKKPKAIQIKTRVDEAMAKQFKEAVEAFGEGTSAALRQAIRDFIAKHDSAKKKPADTLVESISDSVVRSGANGDSGLH